MSKKRLSEKDLLEGLTSHTTHTDELSTASEKSWGTYSEDADKADSGFLVERPDVFDSSRIEFEKGEQDNKLVKQRENSPEIDIDIDELGLEISESDYKAALKRIESLFDAAEPGTPEGEELERLAAMVEEYEEKHFSI
nr:hypothetical protein [Vibrio sp.]